MRKILHLIYKNKSEDVFSLLKYEEVENII